MKKTWLVLIGLLPFLVGCVQNHLMLTAFQMVLVPYSLISFVYLLLWCLLGFFAYPLLSSAKRAVIYAHIPAFAVAAADRIPGECPRPLLDECDWICLADVLSASHQSCREDHIFFSTYVRHVYRCVPPHVRLVLHGRLSQEKESPASGHAVRQTGAPAGTGGRAWYREEGRCLFLKGNKPCTRYCALS